MITAYYSGKNIVMDFCCSDLRWHYAQKLREGNLFIRDSAGSTTLEILIGGGWKFCPFCGNQLVEPATKNHSSEKQKGDRK